MTVVATIVIAETEFVLGRVLADTTVRIELVELVPVESALVPYFWVTEAHDSDALRETVRDRDPKTTIALLDEGGDRTLYRLDWRGDGEDFFDALADNDVLVDAGVREDGWVLQLRAPDKDALSNFRNECESCGVTFDVRNVRYDPNDEDLPYGLTEKQRQALELAFEHGYFEIPRGTTVTDLADRAGVSQQAFSRRLQRAQREVYSHVFPLDG